MGCIEGGSCWTRSRFFAYIRNPIGPDRQQRGCCPGYFHLAVFIEFGERLKSSHLPHGVQIDPGRTYGLGFPLRINRVVSQNRHVNDARLDSMFFKLPAYIGGRSGIFEVLKGVSKQLGHSWKS